MAFSCEQLQFSGKKIIENFQFHEMEKIVYYQSIKRNITHFNRLGGDLDWHGSLGDKLQLTVIIFCTLSHFFVLTKKFLEKKFSLKTWSFKSNHLSFRLSKCNKLITNWFSKKKFNKKLLLLLLLASEQCYNNLTLSLICFIRCFSISLFNNHFLNLFLLQVNT